MALAYLTAPVPRGGLPAAARPNARHSSLSAGHDVDRERPDSRRQTLSAQCSCGAPRDADRRALLRVISSPSIAKLGLVEFELGLLADDTVFQTLAGEAPKRWLRWRLVAAWTRLRTRGRRVDVVLLAPPSRSARPLSTLRFLPPARLPAPCISTRVCACSISILSITPVSTNFLSRCVRLHLVNVPRPAASCASQSLSLLTRALPALPSPRSCWLTHARARKLQVETGPNDER
jgi:hypothetical protein